MLTVTLFRHAKSSWGCPNTQDFDRPLNERGEGAATAMGAYLAANNIRPDLIIASPSARTRQTLCLAQLPAQPPTLFEDALYHAEARDMLKRLHQVDAGIRHVMLLGHNPWMQMLALDLIGSGDTNVRAEIAHKFPTGAVAVITFQGSSWRSISPNSGHLERFVTPRQLHQSERR